MRIFYILIFLSLYGYCCSAKTNQSILDSLYRKAYYSSLDTTIIYYDTFVQNVNESIEDQEYLSDYLFLIAYKAKSEKKNDISFRYYERSYFVASEISDLNRMRKCNTGIASLYKRMGNYTKSILFTKEALELAMLANDDYRQGRHLFDLASYYRIKGSYDSAVLYAEKSFNVFKSIDNSEWEGYALIEMGRSAHELSNYDVAISLNYKALLLNDTSRMMRGFVYNNHSLASLAMGDTSKAKQMIVKCIGIWDDLGKMDLYGIPVLNNLGAILYKESNFDSAATILARACLMNDLSETNDHSIVEYKKSFSYLDSIQQSTHNPSLIFDLGIYAKHQQQIELIEDRVLIEQMLGNAQLDMAQKRIDIAEDMEYERVLSWVIGISFILMIFGVTQYYRYQMRLSKANRSVLINDIESRIRKYYF